MRNINRVVISGNLTRDPEWRGSARNALSLGVAVNDETKNQQTGEWEERPNFVDCVIFGNRAAALERYLEKGTKVTIEGRLRYSSWETADGQKRSKLEVVVDEIEFSNRQGDAGGQRQQRPAQRRQSAAPVAYQPTLDSAQPAQAADAYDDIPF